MDLDVIKSYLVSLGFKVNQPELAKFNDALRVASQQAERVTAGMAKTFVAAGAAVLTTLTAIATGTVGLMDHVAQSDLGFQVMARRMYLSTDAARSLKIATDALGYSLEDIVWGPKELQERFGILQSDQAKMMNGLGGDFESRVRRIRDIRFEFTRLGVEAQYFSMALTGALSKSLFGDENGLLDRLRSLNNWLIANIPSLAKQISQYLTPVVKDVAVIFRDIFDISRIAISEMLKFIGVLSGDDRLKRGAVNIDNVGAALVHVADAMAKVFNILDRIANFVSAHPWAEKLMGASVGAAIGGAAGSLLGGIGALPGAAIGAVIGGAVTGNTDGIRFSSMSKADQARKVAQAISERTGIPAEILFGQFEHETGNFSNRGANSLNNLAGVKNPGGVGYRSFGSLQDFADYFVGLLASPRYHSALGAQSPESYAQALKRGGYYEDTFSNYAAGIRRGEAAYGTTIHGDININIPDPAATPEKIRKAVTQGIRDVQGEQNPRNIVQQGGVFA